MAGCCDHCHDDADSRTPQFRRALWIALAVNVVMFAVEIGAGLRSGSVSLLADSVDFLGDAANYAISLAVLALALRWRSSAALLKAATMAGFGLWVIVTTVQHVVSGTVPDAPTMGAVGAIAMLANFGVAVLLYRFRNGDSNMASVWICTRNDVIGNIAVIAAAAGVFGTSTGWPDVAVAAIMAGLALTGAWRVFRHARRELRQLGALLAVSD